MNTVTSPGRRVKWHTRNIVTRLLATADATREELAEYLKALGVSQQRITELLTGR